MTKYYLANSQANECSGDQFDGLIDQGDQNGDLMCLVTKLKIKIGIRLPFWLLTKIRLLSYLKNCIPIINLVLYQVISTLGHQMQLGFYLIWSW